MSSHTGDDLINGGPESADAAAQPATTPRAEPQAVPGFVATAKGLAQAPSNWLQEGLNDWWGFLSGPDPELFRPSPEFTWTRLFRLLTIVLGLSGVVLGVEMVTIKSGSPEAGSAVLRSQPAVVIILAAAVLAVIYRFFAWLFRISVEPRDAFFVFLLMSLPWVPLTAFMFFLGRLDMPETLSQIVGLLKTLWITFVFVMVIRNICCGVAGVGACRKWRALSSLLLPLTLFAGLIVAIVAYGNR